MHNITKTVGLTYKHLQLLSGKNLWDTVNSMGILLIIYKK